jgi:hypothetical protein
MKLWLVEKMKITHQVVVSPTMGKKNFNFLLLSNSKGSFDQCQVNWKCNIKLLSI